VTGRPTTTAPGDVLAAAYELAEQHRQEAAEAERRAYEAWQAAYGAHEVARDEARVVQRAYLAGSSVRNEVPA
jgi:hypothetical protein